MIVAATVCAPDSIATATVCAPDSVATVSSCSADNLFVGSWENHFLNWELTFIPWAAALVNLQGDNCG
jgi:hypothetical protein